MRIVSTVPRWSELARMSSPTDRVARWEEYEDACAGVFTDYYASGRGRPEERSAAAIAAPAQLEAVLTAEAHVRQLLVEVAERFRERRLLTADDHTVVLLVGVGTANGWVADYRGAPALFVALEYLPEPRFAEILLSHELAHLAQGELGLDLSAAALPCSQSLLVEGTATAASRLLYPGHRDGAYFWMDAEHDGWPTSCQHARDSIARLVTVESNTLDTDPRVAPLFRNRPSPTMPSRAGYWVGDEIARQLPAFTRGDLTELLAITARPSACRGVVATWATLS